MELLRVAFGVPCFVPLWVKSLLFYGNMTLRQQRFIENSVSGLEIKVILWVQTSRHDY